MAGRYAVWKVARLWKASRFGGAAIAKDGVPV